MKHSKASTRLQEIIETTMSDKSMLSTRVESIQLIEQLGVLMDS